jgi:hypothetical protein
MKCVFLLAFVGACTRPMQPDSPTAVVISDPDLDLLWDASLSVLTRLDFVPERQDRAIGIIETLPTVSQQFWEWWRRDVHDDYSRLQADLQTIHRKVTVRFRRTTDENRWEVDVQVDVYRLQSPDRQLTSSAAALHYFTDTLPTTEGLRPEPRGTTWRESLGRDAALERYLLRRILRMADILDHEYEIVEAAARPT